MADGKIYITITDKPIGDGSGNIERQETKEKTPTTLSKYAEHQFMSLISSTSSKITNATVENIGFLTGDYITQRKVKEAISLGSTLRGIGLSAYAGYSLTATAGGALVGGAVGLIGMAVSMGISDITSAIQINRQNVEIDRLREISGLNNKTNGSR